MATGTCTRAGFALRRKSGDALERLTSDPLPDINPRMTSDGKGRLAVAWQGWRGRNSNILLRVLERGAWGREVRVTNRAANDWEPAVAFDASGDVWVAYDSYKSGSYDVLLTRVRGLTVESEMEVAATPRYEAKASVAVDRAGRVWVAWEAGGANWGKDQGYIIRSRRIGVPIGGVREPRVRCLENGQWREPNQPLTTVFTDGANTYQPHVFSDGAGSVYVLAKTRYQRPNPQGAGQRGYWEYRLTRLEGDRWRPAAALPNSKGRSSTRVNGALSTDGALWLAWDTDGRTDAFYHRPIRQQVYAGRLAPAASTTVSPVAPGSAERVEVTAGHPDETGDLRAIRGYTAQVGGQAMRIVRGDFHRHTELSWDGGGAADGIVAGVLPLYDRRGVDGFRRVHRSPRRRVALLVVVHAEDDRHVPRAGRLRPDLRLRAERGVPQRAPQHLLREAFRIARDAVLPAGRHTGSLSGWAAAWATSPASGAAAGGQRYETALRGAPRPQRHRHLAHLGHSHGHRLARQRSRARARGRDLPGRAHQLRAARRAAMWRARMTRHMQARRLPAGGNGLERLGQGLQARHHHQLATTAPRISPTPWSTRDDASRQGILDAIRKRHTYGATDNIILDVRMGEHFMGDDFALSKPSRCE